MHILFSFVRVSYNQRSRGLLRLVPFIEATLWAVALIFLAWLKSYKDTLHSHSYLYSHQVWWLQSSWKLCYEVLIYYVITWHTEMTYRNKKASDNKSCDIKQCYHVLQPSLVSASLWKLWYKVFNLVITWSKVMSPNGCMQLDFFPPNLVYMSFFKLIV